MGIRTLLLPASALLLWIAVGPISEARADDEVAQKSYDINLTRPLTVGQKFRVNAKGSQDVRSTPYFGGQRQPTQQNTVYVVLDADCEIAAVDERGRPIRMKYVIDKCERTTNGRTTVVARKGMTIVGERRDGSTHFSRDGKPLRPEATEALTIVARFEDEGMTHDDLAGSAAPRTVGETWELNKEALLTEIRNQSGEELPPDAVSGKVSFGGLMDYKGHSCLLIETEFSIANWLSELTPGFDLKSAEFTGIIQALFPEDESKPPLAESSKVTIVAHLVSVPQPGQPSMEFKLDVKQRVERDLEPISPSDAPALATGQEPASPDTE